MRNFILSLIWILNASSIHFAKAQDSAIHQYINLNEISKSRVYEIQEKTLALEYHDYFGQWQDMPTIVRNWKNEVMVQMKLGKSFGLNHFVINLSDYSNKWELNKVYSVEVYTEQNKKFNFQVRLVEKPKQTPPSVDVVVNPVQFNCDLLSPKLVEFYGMVSGGRAPYTIQWYILNGAKNDFLYQPKQETVNAGRTMLVQVDKAPSYYVVLFVTDACGGVEKKTIFVTCDDSKKRINTIFVEPLNKTLMDKINANKS